MEKSVVQNNTKAFDLRTNVNWAAINGNTEGGNFGE